MTHQTRDALVRENADLRRRLTAMVSAIEKQAGVRKQGPVQPYANGQLNGNAPGRPRFMPLAFDHIALDLTPNYLIKGLVPRGGLTVIWGPPKCGKSFWAFDLLMHVALGWQYRGRKVRTGPVVYVAAEGASGFLARIEAFKQAKIAEDAGKVPFYLIPDRPNLTEEYDALIEQIRAGLGELAPEVIALDTLNRTMTGSESSDQDMTQYIAAADALRAAFNCSVIIVHHCGHDQTRPRGHTALMGACDCQIAVKRGHGFVTASVEFMKDGPEGDTVAFSLKPIDVGTDDDGDAITSCVVEPADPDQLGLSTQQQKPLSDHQQTLFDVIVKAVDDAQIADPAMAQDVAKAGHSMHVRRDLIRTEFNARQVDAPDITADTLRKRFSNSLASLVKRRNVGFDSENVWLNWRKPDMPDMHRT